MWQAWQVKQDMFCIIGFSDVNNFWHVHLLGRVQLLESWHSINGMVGFTRELTDWSGRNTNNVL